MTRQARLVSGIIWHDVGVCAAAVPAAYAPEPRPIPRQYSCGVPLLVVMGVVPLLLFNWRLLLRLLWQQLRRLWAPALAPSEALHDLIHQQARSHECIGEELLLHKPAHDWIHTINCESHGIRMSSIIVPGSAVATFTPPIDMVASHCL